MVRVLGRRSRGRALLLVGVLGFAACQGAHSGTAHDGARLLDLAVSCGEDEVREYFCDDLLPLSSSRPAPEPYDNCPASAEVRHGSFPALGSVAGFDPGFTAYTRKRVQPGHSCCYGWCAKLTIADPNHAAPSACRDAYGLHESICLREPEGGTSAPASSPFDHCPVAIKPPEVLAFSAPSSALLDTAQTAQRRRDLQLADCCYGWCSKTPSGTVLKSAHPKIK
jgi:hypothetical protein